MKMPSAALIAVLLILQPWRNLAASPRYITLDASQGGSGSARKLNQWFDWVPSIKWATSLGQVNGYSKPLLATPGTIGVGNVGGKGEVFKPDVQVRPLEKNVETITWRPEVIYKPETEVHTLGFCIPRDSYRNEGAYADHCPAGTNFQIVNNQQVCTTTKCEGPFGYDEKTTSVPQQKNQKAADTVLDLLKQQQQFWGANIASTCQTVIVKPVMTCPDDCVPDNRIPNQDLCLCKDGVLPCPQGYFYCPCDPNPFGVCVADTYYCALYCLYMPTWYPAMVARGENSCPMDVNSIDWFNPDPIYPGWSFNRGRRLMGSRGSAANQPQLPHVPSQQPRLLPGMDLQRQQAKQLQQLQQPRPQQLQLQQQQQQQAQPQPQPQKLQPQQPQQQAGAHQQHPGRQRQQQEVRQVQ